MIYSIGNNENKEPYIFFGGTPNELINNLNKYTFINKTNIVSEIKMEFTNGSNYKINIDEKDGFFKLGNDYNLMLCLPSNIKTIFDNIILKNYHEADYFYYYSIYRVYDMNEQQKKEFPNLSFKVGNKIIIINKDKIISNYEKYGKKYDLFISYFNCENIIFGKQFFELFDIYEFNLEKEEINFYINKNKTNVIEEINNKEVKLNYNNNYIIIFLFYFIFVSVILIIIKKAHKNKIIEYYNYYYEI